MITVGPAYIACPECFEQIPVPIEVDVPEERNEDGRQIITCEPDLTDLWAHSMTHDEVPQ